MAISKPIADTIRTKLADPVTGFNATLASLCVSPAYQIATERIDFRNQSQQYFRFRSTPAHLRDLGVEVIWPFCEVYFLEAKQNPAQDRTKPRQFDGMVRFALDFYHAWDDPGNMDFETICDATFDTCVRVFNGIGVSWGAITYGGEIAETMRSDPQQDGPTGPISRYQRIVLGFRMQQ